MHQSMNGKKQKNQKISMNCKKQKLSDEISGIKQGKIQK